jgi:hypothetical protein
MPEEKDKDKIQQAQEEAEARAAARMAANKEEADALAAAQQAELGGLQAHNTAQYENVGQIVGDIQSKINTATAKDALARKREDAYRNITGLGDTLSSLANLVGTAHGAANQQQTYNSHAVVQKAEEARKARKIEMDDLSKRLDEMTARQKDLKAAGSLAEVQLKAKQARESLELASKQRQNEETARQYDVAQVRQAERDARADFVTDRAFTEGQRQFNATNTRLKEAAEAENKSREEVKKLELAAKAAKDAADPKNQAKVLHTNITGIRDELAKKMGYADYNEYLRYQNVKGWGRDIGEQRNKDSRAIRNKRSEENPEIEEFLELLQSPESLTEEQIRMLMGASSVFTEAINAAGGDSTNPNNGKKKVW